MTPSSWAHFPHRPSSRRKLSCRRLYLGSRSVRATSLSIGMVPYISVHVGDITAADGTVPTPPVVALAPLESPTGMCIWN